VNLRQEHEAIIDVLDNCPLDCLAEGSKAPPPEIQRAVLKREFNQLFYRLKKEGVERFPFESLPMDFRWNLCATRLRMGRFDNWDGWQFRGNFATTFYQKSFPTPKWMGQPIKSEHGLKVCGEQGVGDEILFMSAFPDLLVRLGPKAVEVHCHPRLVPIFERSFRVKASSRPAGLSDVRGESMMLMGELLKWYRHDGRFPKKPFLKPDPGLVSDWTDKLEKLGDRKKIGIAWKARHGSLDPRDLMTENAIYVNLQYGERAPKGAVDVDQDPLEDLEGHFALVAALDKVVTVTQTVVHVAGSIGKECYAIVPDKGTGEVNNRLWYYGTGGSHYVYGSVTVYGSIDDYRSRRSGRT
jgi:hypothetical protein